MTPQEFIARWNNNALTERGGAQAHFDDLCDLLGVDKPRDPDNYCFERGAKDTGGGDGWANVWKRGLDAQQVAHFLTQCIFCTFAEDEGLLHDSPTDNSAIFTALLKSAYTDTTKVLGRLLRLNLVRSAQ